MTVNNFRKYVKDDAVISLSKTLIKKWKLLLPGVQKLLVTNLYIASY